MIIKPKDYSATRHLKEGFSNKVNGKSKPHWCWRVLKIKICIILALVVVAAIAIIWFAGKPRSIDWASGYLFDKLQRDMSPYRLDSSEVNLYLDIKHAQLVVTLDDIVVRGDGGYKVAMMPELRINLEALPLLSGNVRIHELVMMRPNVKLYRQEDGSLSFGFSDDKRLSIIKTNDIDLKDKVIGKVIDNAVDDVDKVGKSKASDNVDINEIFEILNNLGLKRVTLKLATIQLGRGNHKILWNVPKLQLSISNKHSKEFDVYAEIGVENKNVSSVKLENTNKNINKFVNTKKNNISIFSGRFRFGDNLKEVEASLNVKGFSPAILADMDWHFSRLKNLNMKFDGSVAVFLSPDSKMSDIRAELTSVGGVLSDDMLFESPLKIANTVVKVQIMNDFSNLKIDQLDIGFARGGMKVVGDVLFSQDGVGLKLDAKIDSIPINDLSNIWPLKLAPVTREWVTKNMSAGLVKSGVASIKLKAEDSNKHPLPASFIKASLDLVNVSIRYKPNFPLVTGVNGVVDFTGSSMKVRANSGKTMNSAILNKGTVEIADFFADGVPINVDLNVKVKAKDVARFMDKDHLNIAPHIKLDSTKVSGDVEGNVVMKFPLYSKKVKKYYFNYDIKTKLKDVSQDGLLGKWDISHFSGNIHAFNDGLKLNGKTGLNGIAADIVIDDQYRPVKKTDYKLKAKLMADQVSSFGVSKPSFLNGMIDADIEIVEKSDGSITNAKLGLNNASIDLDVIKWKKPVGENAFASFTHYKKDNDEVIKNLQFTSDSLSAKGDIIISADNGVLRNLKLEYLRFGDNDSAVDYRLDGESEYISLLGSKFDLSPWLEGDKDNEKSDVISDVKDDVVDENNPFEFFDNKFINLKLDSLKLGKLRKIKKVNGVIDCRGKVCESVSFSASYPKGEGFTFNIKRNDGKRKLSLVSGDASKFMNVIDMSKYVRGGKLSYEGYFDDSKQGAVLDARLLMTDFNVIKGGVLTKLLTLGSLTGLIDTLQGNGIWFKKLSVDSIFHNNKVDLKNGRAFGNAVGITAEGELKPFAGKLKIKGTIVPSYVANSILGKIPLLGKILTGGEGEGVIAMNYSMKGDSSDPDISVNPLSLLTPGFLRKLFDVLEIGGDGAKKAKISSVKH